MTRFNISLNEGVDMIFHALNNSWGGEIFYSQKIPSFNILDLANAIAPECEHKIIGIRPGEKIHEEMITPQILFPHMIWVNIMLSYLKIQLGKLKSLLKNLMR